LRSIIPKSSVLRFLWTQGLSDKVFIKKCFLFTVGSVYRVKRFTPGSRNSQGRSKVVDDARPSRPVETATEATMQRVEDLIPADRRITIHSVPTALWSSHGLACT
jgi:hypothetical protein